MPADDPLSALRDQLDRTHAAARRLADEAAGGVGAGGTPAGGWKAPEDGAEDGPSSELAQLLASLELLRAAIPPELVERLVAVLREFLLALRALVDYALGRLEARRVAGAEVQDIPIA